MAKYFGAHLEIPDIYNISEDDEATKSILEHRNIKSGCMTFNVDIDVNQNFKDFWNTVMIYTKGFKLSQDSYIRILNTLIQGSANRTLCELVKDNKPLHEILNTLNDLFSVRRTVVDDMRELNNFTRQANEDIKRTMQKAKVAVGRVQHLWDPVLWQQGREKEILKSVLRQVITTKTRQRLDAEEMKYLKTGTYLSYDAIIDFVDTYESTHNQIPKTEMALKINVCTGAPKDTTENEQQQQDTHININELSTLLEKLPTNMKTRNAIQQIKKAINSIDGEPSKKRRLEPSLVENNNEERLALEHNDYKMKQLQYNQKQEPQLIKKRGNVYNNPNKDTNKHETHNDYHNQNKQHENYNQNNNKHYENNNQRRYYDNQNYDYNNTRHNNNQQQQTYHTRGYNRNYNNRNYNQNYRGNNRYNNNNNYNNYNNRGNYPRRGYNQNYYNRNYNNNNRGNRY